MPSGLPLCYATHLLLVFAISDSYVRDVGHMKWVCRHIISQLFVAEIERADKWVFWGEFWWLKIFHHWVVSALSGVSLNHEEGVHTNIPS